MYHDSCLRTKPNQEFINEIKVQINIKIKKIQEEFNIKLTELASSIYYLNSHFSEIVEQSFLHFDEQLYSSINDTLKIEENPLPSTDENNHQIVEFVSIKQESDDLEEDEDGVEYISHDRKRSSSKNTRTIAKKSSANTATGNNTTPNNKPKKKINPTGRIKAPYMRNEIPLAKKPLPCTECSEILPTGRALVVHLVQVHGKEKPFKCDSCPVTFIDRATQKKHIQFSKHYEPQTKPENYVCDICSKIFQERMNFIVHRRTHTGEKFFECDICGKKCAAKYALEVHMRIHSGIRPYLCHHCSKTFAQETPFLRHMTTHTGSKRHKCNLCDKAFPSKGQLTVHTFSHTGERPYVCPLCQRGYTKRYHVKKHLISSHKVDDVDAVFPKNKRRTNRINNIDETILSLSSLPLKNEVRTSPTLGAATSGVEAVVK